MGIDDPVPTPPPADAPRPQAARDARIAELRERRRARLRWLAIRGLLSLAAVTVGGALLLYWLFNTLGGRDLLLGQIAARLPEGDALTWSRAEGPAAGPMTLHDVRYVHRGCPDRDGKPVAYPGCAAPLETVFTARELMLDPALQPLLGRRLRLDALAVREATLSLPKDDTPFELPRWPESLPKIAPPLALQADAIAIDGLTVSRAGEHLVALGRVRGGLEAEDGRLHVEHLEADTDRGRFTLHGDYAPAKRYRMDLVATARLPAATGRTPAALGLVARGDLRALDIALSGRAPGPLSTRVHLVGEDRPRWTFTAKGDALTLAALTGSDDDAPPYVFDLRGDGLGGKLNLQGRVAQGDLVVAVRPSTLVVERQTLLLAPLAIDALGGTLRADGRADFTVPEDARFDGTLQARGLRWQGEAKDAVAIVGDGDFKLSGHLRAWTADGTATLVRADERAQLALQAQGDAQGARIRTLRATMPSGRLDGSGDVAWAPALRWTADATLAGFDPGYLLPDWRGAVNGALRSTGATRGDGGLDVTVDADKLGGRLRSRTLGGRAHLLAHLPARAGGRTDVEGDVALALGASRIDAKGRVAERYDIDARVSPLQLDDLLPSAQGTLRGTLRLTGLRAAPDVAIDLAGDGVRVAGYAAEALQARGRLPWRDGAAGELTVDATGVDAGLALERVHLQARGAVERLSLDGEANADAGRLALSGEVAKRGEAWAGTLATLGFVPRTGAAWRLQAPTAFVATPQANGLRLRIASGCFATDDRTGNLCADIDWPTRADVHGQALPLALLEPYLSADTTTTTGRGQRWRLTGAVDLDAQVRPRGATWQGNARIRSADGGLALGAREVLGYRDLALDGRFDPQGLDATLAAALTPDGRVDAQIATGWDAYAPLHGRIAADTRALTWMELFSPDIVDPQGHLQGEITLAGTRVAPALGGQARLSDFRAELPALALGLRNGEARMDTQPDGTAVIGGSVRSGEGTLRIDGTLGWQDADTPLRLALTGEKVLVSDTRQLHAVVDPSILVRYAAGQPLSVAGAVRISSAKLDLERLDSGVSRSEDVVVLDPADPERGPATPLDLDLALQMGDDVRLHGFGLDGTLGGSVHMRARPGRETVASGALDVDGRYTAYGQKLQITRGRLVWTNSPFGDPVVDVRAEREVGDVTAGIDVSGRASSPVAKVWSDPATSESEALAYLALGRPLASASADESRQLSAATAALSAGNLLASQLGAKIGLDDAGVSESRALGGSVVGIGKYLSPRLYVSYGVSLLGTGQVLTLKYLLRKGFDVEIESSTIEHRGSVNWRKER